MAPKVKVEWTEGEYAAVSGKVLADVPFGHFGIEVVIRRDGEADDAIWVDVYDGVGEFSVGPGARIRRVEVDPGGLTPTRAWSVRRVDPA